MGTYTSCTSTGSSAEKNRRNLICCILHKINYRVVLLPSLSFASILHEYVPAIRVFPDLESMHANAASLIIDRR